MFDEQEATKQAAAAIAPVLSDALKVAVQESASLARWILATLVLINGGGIVTALPVAEIPLGYRIAASVLFVTGILSVLTGAAIALVTAPHLVAKSLGKAFGYWAAVARSGQRDEDIEREIDAAAGVMLKTPALWLSLVSLACFVLGVVAVALGYWR